MCQRMHSFVKKKINHFLLEHISVPVLSYFFLSKCVLLLFFNLIFFFFAQVKRLSEPYAVMHSLYVYISLHFTLDNQITNSWSWENNWYESVISGKQQRGKNVWQQWPLWATKQTLKDAKQKCSTLSSASPGRSCKAASLHWRMQWLSVRALKAPLFSLKVPSRLLSHHGKTLGRLAASGHGAGAMLLSRLLQKTAGYFVNESQPSIDGSTRRGANPGQEPRLGSQRLPRSLTARGSERQVKKEKRDQKWPGGELHLLPAGERVCKTVEPPHTQRLCMLCWGQ